MITVPCYHVADHDTYIESSNVHSHSDKQSDNGCENHGCNPFGMCACIHTTFFINEGVRLDSSPKQLIFREFHDSYSDMGTTQYFEAFFHPPIG